MKQNENRVVFDQLFPHSETIKRGRISTVTDGKALWRGNLTIVEALDGNWLEFSKRNCKWKMDANLIWREQWSEVLTSSGDWA